MNQLAVELNSVIERSNPHVLDMLSDMGKNLFFPKGILTQSAEAKQKAHRINATIGIAKQDNHVMSLPSVVSSINGIEPDNYLPYAPSFGIPALRDKWKRSLFEKNPSLDGKSISLPVVTAGITHGVSTFADLWINAGDTVILPDMMWGNYNMTFGVRNRARIVHYNAYTSDIANMDIDSFEKLIRQEAANNSKIITVLNFPHNPTGYTVTPDEASRMASVLIDVAKNGTNVVVAFDDAYFGLFFEQDAMKESMFAMLAGADERLVAVKLDGATKEDYVWGLRTGFITYGIAPHCKDDDSNASSETNKALEELYLALEKKTAGCIRGAVSNVSHLSQSIILKSMEDENYAVYKQEKFDLLKSRSEEIRKVLKDPSYNDAFEPYPYNSGYFMCVRIKDSGIDAEVLRVHLLEKYGVGLISIGKNNLRVAFSCLEKDQVKLLFDLLLKGINELKTQ
ncbi:AspC3 [Desulfamplus magnetovallimortis]|uniref:AspC3 n=1 Tax=Desulfamplus magnetovallimortis TaxID=1246637 RepID=A0A1W1HDY2_9BACT|nr:aminotransferase class I/II-fold pyridoxal phosphate-dependent enzyme [Desulfamplus magnetovallimortis]SLM30592.1 AspC3 [Desulfamplus magnetovallimortis]